MRKLFLLLATVIWGLFWWWWYTCKICSTCLCYQAQAPVVPPVTRESGVLLFNLNDSDALTQFAWPVYRDSLAQLINPNQLLEIEGHFLDEESNPSSYENLGLSRAAAIRHLFPDSLFNRIKLTALKIVKRNGMDENPFVASAFYMRPASDKIIDVGDKTLIYFKSNSNQRIQDQEIEEYLNQLAIDHKSDRSVFNITGHTDDTGSEKQNLLLGLSRANAIKNYLVKKGIPSARIVVTSKGETEPIVDNRTPEGRQKNRRIEIEIIQKL